MNRILLIAVFIMFLQSCSEPTSNESVAAATETAADELSNTTPLAGETFKEGIHYRVLEKPIDMGNGKIVVTEFFWYGCPHCEEFEPYLKKWDKTKAEDVVLERSPAVWNEPTIIHGNIYYVAQTLERFEELHDALFKEVEVIKLEKKLEVQVEKFQEVFEKYGLSKEAMIKTMNSKKVNDKLSAAIELMGNASVSSTPNVMVNGKYVVIKKYLTSIDQVFDVVNFLVEKERRDLAE
jgi:thiol:disulfide interchange protein DsbA